MDRPTEQNIFDFLLLLISFGTLLSSVECRVFDGVIHVNGEENECFHEDCAVPVKFNPYRPLILCQNVPGEFFECEDPMDIMMLNITEDGRFGCQFDQEKSSSEGNSTVIVNCTVLHGIECHGDRVFQREVPCVKYNGHHFVTILMFSVFLGFIGVDRFCLGHIPTAVGKLVTIGGLGVWWVIDIILLVTGQLQPKDGSSWCP